MNVVHDEPPQDFAHEEVDAAVEDHEAVTEEKEEESKPNNN